ncbi:MAG: hypothetical protein JOZ27_00530, partial [Caulobacteraceae bacterium]|nr:hypothetical protein [Caulobacteraceae bacterium]
SGLGVLLAGFTLDAIGFPRDVAHRLGAALPNGVLVRLILAHGPGAAVVVLAALAIFLPYGVTRRRHDSISAELRARRAAVAAG